MLSTEYTELKARCLKAAAQGYTFGRAAGYVVELQALVGTPDLPADIVADSPAHILFLLDMLDQGQKASAKPKAKIEARAEPRAEIQFKDPPVPVPEPEIEVTAEVEAEAEEAPVEAPVEAEEAPVASGGKKKSKKGK